MDYNKKKIDGFWFETERRENGNYDIKIVFTSHHKEVTTRKYRDIEEKNKQKIWDKMFIFTEHNLNEKEIIPFPKILKEIKYLARKKNRHN